MQVISKPTILWGIVVINQFELQICGKSRFLLKIRNVGWLILARSMALTFSYVDGWTVIGHTNASTKYQTT